jgi:hypothetical protein
MSFIELTLKSKSNPIAVNISLIESVGIFDGSVYLYVRSETENYYLVKEPYSEVMAKIHKVKRLEIASRVVGTAHKTLSYDHNFPNIAAEALFLAEELIKQNENME